IANENFIELFRSSACAASTRHDRNCRFRLLPVFPSAQAIQNVLRFFDKVCARWFARNSVSTILISLRSSPVMCKTLRFCFATFVLLAICALSAMAQGTVTGAVGGVVTNPNKEVVPGATITVKNSGTAKEDTATADGEGRFKVTNLQPGNYSVTINASGFAPFTQENVVVE